MKVVTIENFIVKNIHKSRKKNDVKLLPLGFVVDDKLEIEIGDFFDPETGDVRKPTFDDLLFAGIYYPLVSKAELLAKLTPDELTDLYTKKSSNVEVEIFWDQISNQRVVDLVKNPVLQNAGILTQERLEEIISI